MCHTPIYLYLMFSYDNILNNISMDENYLEYKHKLKKATMRYNSSYPEVVHNNNRR